MLPNVGLHLYHDCALHEEVWADADGARGLSRDRDIDSHRRMLEFAPVMAYARSVILIYGELIHDSGISACRDGGGVLKKIRNGYEGSEWRR